VLRTSRNQLARLSLPGSWGDVFCQLRDAMVILRDEAAPHEERRKTIGGLCSLRPPEAAGAPEAAGQAGTGGAAAAKTIAGLAAFAGYGITVIEAFDNDDFDLPAVRGNVRDISGGSYAELAAARLELGISPDSSRSIIRRFRVRSGLAPLPERP
jgi:hypothetical protein